LGERLLCKQEVIGSSPFTSTTGVWRRRAARRSEKITKHRPGKPGGVLFEG
jgi:hypothetical protein